MSHRSYGGSCDAHLQRGGHPNDVPVLGVVLVDPAVVVPAVLSVPAPAVLVVVKVEPFPTKTADVNVRISMYKHIQAC